MENITPLSPSAQETARAQGNQPSPKFIVLTVTVDNPSDRTGKIEMQGNFDLNFGMQILTESAYQQLGPCGISLLTPTEGAKPIFTFESGKSTAWVQENPQIQFALQLTDDCLVVDRLNISGRISIVEIKYLGN